MRKPAAVVLGGAALSVLFLSGGCSSPEAICSDGEYPVVAVGSTTGRACVAEGEEPSAGYVRFPSGKVPEHVGDEWDEYWRGHVIDADGQEVAQ